MPTYEFLCKNCDHVFEVFTSISAKEKGLDLDCQQCGGKNIKQAITSYMFYSPGSFKESAGRSSAAGSSSCSGCHSGSCGSCSNCQCG